MKWLELAWARSIAPFRRRSRPVRSGAQLGEFLSRHAAFIAQKCAEDYCRNKVGLSHHALTEEQTFREAMAICRWEGYAAVLAGLAVVAERLLVDAGYDAERTGAALAQLCERALAQHPVPAHRPQGWGDVVAALPERLRAARSAPQQPFAEVAAASGRRLFEVLPIHQRYREFDEQVVIGAVHFNFVGFADRLHRDVDAAAVGGDLGLQLQRA